MNELYSNHKNPDLSHLNDIVDKPIIGLDLDGVISSTRETFLNEIESMYGIKLNNNAASVKPQTGQSFGNLIQDIVKNNPDIYQKIKPIEGSSEATHKLKEYYDIKIITHRVHSNWLNKETNTELKNQSIKWLNDNNIYYDEFIFPTPKNKTDIPADVYIDDRKENIENVINKNKIGIMYLRPHNPEEVPWDSWLASSEVNKDMDYISNNEVEQWDIISNSLIECLNK